MFQMNFKDKRTRRIIAASASAAVVVGGGAAFGIVTAQATSQLTLANSTTNVNLLALDPSANAKFAKASYQFRTTDAGSGPDELLQLVSAPTGGSLTFADWALVKAVPVAADFTDGGTAASSGTLSAPGTATAYATLNAE